MGTAAADVVRDIIERAIAGNPIASGTDVENVTVTKAGRRDLVRVVVDRDGGIDLDAVAEMSRLFAEALDEPEVAATFSDAYVLEVTSPGVDRPLTTVKHWRRSIDRLVLVTQKSGPEILGRILGVDEASATISVEGQAEPVVVPFSEVEKALVQIEFNRPTADVLAGVDVDEDDIDEDDLEVDDDDDIDDIDGDEDDDLTEDHPDQTAGDTTENTIEEGGK